jgi:eukaryotic-like serine/threonine-protein kinase
MGSFATRIAIVTVILVALSVGIALSGALLISQRIATEAVTSSLSASQGVQRYLQTSRARELALTTDLLAADPHDTAYLVEATRGQFGEEGQPDLRSIFDLIDERRREMGFDFAMMLDPDGRVLVRTDRPEVSRQSLADHPLVAPVMADLIPEYGPWREGNRLFNVAVVPITTAFELVGFLITGLAIDDGVAADIKRISGVDTAFISVSDGRASIAASTLSLRHGETLTTMLSNSATALPQLSAGQALDRIDVDFDGESWVARAEPIQDANGNVLGSVLTIDSLDARLAGHRNMQTALIVAGVLAILLALVLSTLIARRIARPVAALAEVADQAAQGEYDQDIDIRGKDEVGTLARAISRLLADLREQQEIAGYVSDLSRHMEDASTRESADTSDETAMDIPDTQEAFLLALQWRGSKSGSESEALTALDGWLPQLAEWAKRFKTQLIPGGGARLYMVFPNDQRSRLERCLDQLLQACGRQSNAPAMALANGQVISTGISLGRTRSRLISGTPVFHCERLLTEAGPGRLLLSPSAFKVMEERLTDLKADTRLSKGLVSERKFYQLISLNSDLTQAETMATARTSAGTTGPKIMVGAVLGDRYEILERVGSGAMGTVFRARDRKLDDVVALKMINPDMTRDPDHLERMKSEIRLARRITHPNVLRTHDFWEINGHPIISMEYVRGITLSQLLESSGRLKLAAGLRVCGQVLQGLNAAHQAGVLHRDIKPANIILDQSGNARLMDFGIARQATNNDSDLTQPGTMIGTANYMAPEIVLGKTADQRSDLYAMGVMMNEIFTGRLPFTGDSAMAVCMAHVQQQPDPPSKAWPEIPPMLEEVILTCLAKEPDQRYPDAETLLKQLIQVRRQSAAATGEH